MKTFLLLIVLFLNFSIFSQNKAIEIDDHIYAGFQKSYDNEREENIFRLSFSYMNEKTYKTVFRDGKEYQIPYSFTGGGGFTIKDKKDVLVLIEDLKTISEKIEKNKDFEIKREKYKLNLYKMSRSEIGRNMLFIQNENEEDKEDYTFTRLTKDNLITWLDFLESIDFEF